MIFETAAFVKKGRYVSALIYNTATGMQLDIIVVPGIEMIWNPSVCDNMQDTGVIIIDHLVVIIDHLLTIIDHLFTI